MILVQQQHQAQFLLFHTFLDLQLALLYGTQSLLETIPSTIKHSVHPFSSFQFVLSINLYTAAVTDVQTEPLAPDFSGILGIALPLNSVIAADVPPLTSNSLDGSAWTTNLFSINTAPSFHFLSLALSRPGSDQVQSVLGIGKHPTALVPNPSLIQYSPPVFDGSEALFWKVVVKAITIYVNGVAKQVQLGTSNTGAPFPNAVLDSGTPLIFTTTTIANAIYGSIGVSPATDGTCKEIFSVSSL